MLAAELSPVAERPRPALEELQRIAKRVRVDIVRMTHRAGSGHPGGSLSATEILVSLYFDRLRVDPKQPAWEERDRFILSKGHCTPGLYATLAERGFFPARELEGFRKLGSRLQGHADVAVPGVEMSTGSLGQGLSFGNGVALGLRLRGSAARVYVLLGDGELQEGQVWEAAMTSAHHRLDNLCAIVDYNKVSQTNLVNENKNLEPLPEKWRAFGWHVEVIDGHSFAQVRAALDKAEATKGKPTVVIANTVKGKGVSFMESRPEFHGRAPTAEELERALRELGA